MSQSIGDNKRIAKNTLLLYVRMFVLMAVNLFTSRVVLQCLGVDDFGIYSIVGSVVVLFSFLNSAMSSCTSRFLSFHIGRNDPPSINKYFSASINVYLVILLIIFVLAETIGLYVVNNILNLPSERMTAVNIVYQFSILTFGANMIRVPYNACIISYEKMDFYAYLSILDVIAKLGGIYLLYLINADRLILYAFIILIITILITLAYFLYCRYQISTSVYKSRNIGKDVYKDLLGFSGWSLFSGIANIGSNAGVNMLLNVFCGVVVNAAVGIANQVSNAVYALVHNFQTAFTPQITKLYAAGEKDACYRLVFHSSKFSFYLFGTLILPLVICMPVLLSIWLGVVPDYACEFTNLILFYLLIDALFTPLWLFINATGNIRTHQIVTGLLILANFPIAYFLQKIGLSPNSVWYARIIINVIANVFRLVYMFKVFKFPSIAYLRKVLVPVICVSVLLLVSTYLGYSLFNDGYLWTFIFICSSFIYSAIIIFIFGLNKSERDFLKRIMFNRLNYKIKSQA